MRSTIFNNGNLDGIGLDISSIDIARGRDQGLAPYYKYLDLITPGGLYVKQWSDLLGPLSANVYLTNNKHYKYLG